MSETVEKTFPADWRGGRCGHNFPILDCPYKECVAGELYDALNKLLTYVRNYLGWETVDKLASGALIKASRQQALTPNPLGGSASGTGSADDPR